MHITTPISYEKIKDLKAGDSVRLSGIIYTGRDAAHKRMCEALKSGEELPFELNGQVIYYVGPCPHREGEVIGSCGPTTSGRMDAYAPLLLEKGLCAMIGKGKRNDEVKEAMLKYNGVYFGAIGGAGALISKHIKSSEIIAYEDLGTEAIRRLEVENLPLTVVIDTFGNDLYDIGKNKYRKL